MGYEFNLEAGQRRLFFVTIKETGTFDNGHHLGAWVKFDGTPNNDKWYLLEDQIKESVLLEDMTKEELVDLINSHRSK